MTLPKYFPKRLCMTIFGVMLCSLAVGFFKCSLFGVDPFQCFAQGIWGRFFDGRLSYGTCYAILNALMLVIDLFLDKHYIGIATLINLFLTGYIVDVSTNLLTALCPGPTLLIRILFLAIGIVAMCFASAMYMTSDLGVSVYDAIPIIISNRSKKPFKYVRVASDFVCVAVGAACGLLPGLGTLITAFFMGPLIDFFNRHFAEPFLYGKKNV